MSDKTSATANSLQRIVLERPILTCLVLLVIAFIFKWVDTFVLRLDERLGEIILCKALGFVMVIVFVWACGRRLQDIGLHSRRYDDTRTRLYRHLVAEHGPGQGLGQTFPDAGG